MGEYKCCICGKMCTGWGNNPNGALTKDGKRIIFKDTDRCCDECNTKYVIPGRFHKLYKDVYAVDDVTDKKDQHEK